MPDICMCTDNKCPYSAKCYRFTATPTPRRQTYFKDSPLKGDKCEYFYPTLVVDNMTGNVQVTDN